MTTLNTATAGTSQQPTTDEVDKIRAAWAKHRPDFDVSPLEVFSRVSRLNRFLSFKRRQAFAQHQLEEWEFDVLSALRRSGDRHPLSPGALMAELLVSSGTMTNRIDRLESKGLVKRKPDPSDRRGVLVKLTAKGKKLVDSTLQLLVDCEHEMLSPLDTHEREDLAQYLRTLLIPLELTQPKQK